MKSTLEQYKWIIMVSLMVIAYCILRITLNDAPVHTTYEGILAFNQPRPYVDRVLVPLLALPLYRVTDLPALGVFFLLEIFCTAATLAVVQKILCEFIPQKMATLMTFIFFCLLPLAYLLHLRYPLFFPYDSMTILLMGLAFFLVLQQRWYALFAVMVLESLNRESAPLIVFLVIAIHGGRMPLRKLLPWLVAYLAAFIAIRLAINFHFRNVPGEMVMFRVGTTHVLRILNNSMWLRNATNLPPLLAFMGYLPLLWWMFFDYIPPQLRRVRFVALLYWVGLLFVGNLYEPRVYGEILVMLFCPVAIAAYRWASEQQPYPLPTSFTWCETLERYGVSIVLGIYLALLLPLTTVLSRYAM